MCIFNSRVFYWRYIADCNCSVKPDTMIFFQDYAFPAVSAQRAERFSDGVRDLLIEKSPQSSSDSTSFILSVQFFFQLFLIILFHHSNKFRSCFFPPTTFLWWCSRCHFCFYFSFHSTKTFFDLASIPWTVKKLVNTSLFKSLVFTS